MLNVKRMMEIILDSVLQQGVVNMVREISGQRKVENFFIITYNLLLCDTMSFERYMVKVTHNIFI
jgi:ABC-type dipeptide/oligopeptide/nickel transport system ATPase subunit